MSFGNEFGGSGLGGLRFLGVYGFQGFSALGFRVYVALSPEFQRPSTLAGP